MLNSSAVDGNINMVKYIFKRYYSLIDKYDYFPLYVAYRYNNFDIVKFLLKQEYLRTNANIIIDYKNKYSIFWKQIVDEIVEKETIKKNLKQLNIPEDIINLINLYIKD